MKKLHSKISIEIFGSNKIAKKDPEFFVKDDAGRNVASRKTDWRNNRIVLKKDKSITVTDMQAEWPQVENLIVKELVIMETIADKVKANKVDSPSKKEKKKKDAIIAASVNTDDADSLDELK